jgi:hypothetical protein
MAGRSRRPFADLKKIVVLNACHTLQKIITKHNACYYKKRIVVRSG